jgi:hypothetical protein
MSARLTFIAASALIVASAAIAADPAKPDLNGVAGPNQPQRELVLASAETRAPTSVAEAQAQAPAPVKHRVARVTTCRCGDSQPTETQAE